MTENKLLQIYSGHPIPEELFAGIRSKSKKQAAKALLLETYFDSNVDTATQLLQEILGWSFYAMQLASSSKLSIALSEGSKYSTITIGRYPNRQREAIPQAVCTLPLNGYFDN